VQEAFVEMARQPSVPENEVAWLYRVVRNRALNAARSRRRRQCHEAKVAQFRPAAAPGLDPLDTLALGEALDDLPPVERQLVVLRVWGRLEWNEIATVTDLPKTTACRRYQLALAQLKTHLEPSCSAKINPNPPKSTGCPTS
jgi:RNA polymerase sigma-70 factor (ECF subfamily)